MCYPLALDRRAYYVLPQFAEEFVVLQPLKYVSFLPEKIIKIKIFKLLQSIFLISVKIMLFGTWESPVCQCFGQSKVKMAELMLFS